MREKRASDEPDNFRTGECGQLVSRSDSARTLDCDGTVRRVRCFFCHAVFAAERMVVSMGDSGTGIDLAGSRCPARTAGPKIQAMTDNGDDKPKYLDIPLGQSRRWAGLIGYVLLFVAVSGVLVLMFMWFTASLRLAVGLVLFLVGYMTLM